VNGRTRVYYTATAAGKKRLGTMVGEWQRITDAVAGIVMGGKHVAV
jgi:DNA-binding PadR family transcriptional regulator